MKTKAEINKAINNLSLPYGCDREPIRKLVEAITGVDLAERKYSIGMKFTLDGEPCMLVAGDSWKMAIINTETGCRRGNTVCVRDFRTWRGLPQSVFDALLGKYSDAVVVFPIT